MPYQELVEYNNLATLQLLQEKLIVTYSVSLSRPRSLETFFCISLEGAGISYDLQVSSQAADSRPQIFNFNQVVARGWWRRHRLPTSAALRVAGATCD